MKTIVAGSRTVTGYEVVEETIIDIKYFPPDWKTYGKKAGMIRNKMMGDYAHALIAVWDGQSNGTRQMINYAKKKGLKVFMKITDPVYEREYMERKVL